MTADLPLLTISIGLAALALSGAVVVFLRRDGGAGVPPMPGDSNGAETQISPELAAVLQRRTLRRGRVPVDSDSRDEGDRD